MTSVAKACVRKLYRLQIVLSYLCVRFLLNSEPAFSVETGPELVDFWCDFLLKLLTLLLPRIKNELIGTKKAPTAEINAQLR
jgi:hypothetical protein